MSEALINFSDAREKRAFLDKARSIEGKWRVDMTRFRPRRTDRQNRYYWPCFCDPFADWLSETQGETYTQDDAHEIFKREFLTTCVLNKKTGQVIPRTRSTTDLTTVEFNEFLDKCAKFLAEFCEIVVPDPGEYHEHDEPTKETAEAVGSQS